VIQTTTLSGEIFHPRVNRAIVDPFAKFEQRSFIPEILKEFKICIDRRRADRRRYRLSNITCLCTAHFVAGKNIDIAPSVSH